VSARRSLEDSLRLVAVLLQLADDVKKPERPDSGDKLLRQSSEQVAMLSELPLDVLDLGALLEFRRLSVCRFHRPLPILESTSLEHLDQPLRRLSIALMLVLVKTEIDPLLEMLPIFVGSTKIALLSDVQVKPNGDVNRGAEVGLARLELGTTGTSDMLACFQGRLGVSFLVGEVESEVAASLE
jgi:hypothetical protein